MKLSNKLNLGCGLDYKEGWVNVDIIGVKKDIKMDLNKLPYDFEDNSFDTVNMSMILEHLDNPIMVLKEVTRITKVGGTIIIKVPHANSYASNTDIQHRTKFTENSFNEDLIREYDLNLSLQKYYFIFSTKFKRIIPFKKYLKIFFNGIYEDICFELEVFK